MSAVLLIDVGNTSTALALRRGRRIGRVHRCVTAKASEAELSELIQTVVGTHRVHGACAASVVPRRKRIWSRAVARTCEVDLMGVVHAMELGVGIDYPKPASVGPDRLANAAGAIDRYGAPVIVADFGTALTFDVVTRGGDYVGGVIAPGLPLMTDYLSEKTALLPHVPLRGGHRAIGRSTEGAMQSGARHGYRGMVREITRQITAELGETRCTLCATGGYAEWALKDSGMSYIFDPSLTLHGVGVIYDLNTSG